MKSNSNVLSYKGYHGTVEYSLKDNVLYGKVMDVNSIITYEGNTIKELKEDFEGAINDYLKACAENGESPEKPYSGSFNVRISPQLHRKLAIFANSRNISINKSVNQAIQKLVKS